MKMYDVQQGSDEWLSLRLGVLTASELDQIIVPSMRGLREGAMPGTYIFRKVAEKWLGRSVDTASSFAMEQGAILEAEARPLLSIKLGQPIRTVGFITTDDGVFGASPDGMLADGSGVEIKCPQPTAHFRYLLTETIPAEYLLQCQGGMFVTGAKRWTFMSHCRDAPPLVLEIARDEEVQLVIAEAVHWFRQRREIEYARVVAINGGEPQPEPVGSLSAEEDPFAVTP